MSNFNDLTLKINDIVALLESYEKEISEKLKDVSKIEDVKFSLNGEIKKLSSNVSKLQEESNSLSSNLQSKRDEVESLKNLYITKTQAVDANLFDLELKKKELEKNISESESAKVIYEEKLKEANDRYLKAVELEAKASKELELAENIENVTNIVKRENDVIALQNKADERLQEAIKKESSVKEILDAVESIKASNELKEKSLLKIDADNKGKESFLKDKEFTLNNTSNDLDKRKQALDYQELRINKIIKEKNIADILNAK